MEENSLLKKIIQEGNYIKQSLHNFCKTFQTKNIQLHNFKPYLSAVQNLFDLNILYLEDYFDLISKKDLIYFIKNNKLIFNDFSKKFKSLQLYILDQKEFKKQENLGICKICTMRIEQRNIYDVKNNIQGDQMHVLKKMFRKIQEQNNIPLFTLEQDKQFYRKLHRALAKKEQILMVTDSHLQAYLQNLMRCLNDIKFVETDLKDSSVDIPQNINWNSKLKTQINQSLLREFKGKIPPWVQKSFDYLSKIYAKLTKKSIRSIQTQTDQFDPNQINILKKNIQQYKQKQKISRIITQDYQNQLKQFKQELKKLINENNILKKNEQQSNNYSINIHRISRTVRNSVIEKDNELGNVKLKKSSKTKFVKTGVNQKKVENGIIQKENQTANTNSNYRDQKQNIQIRPRNSLTQHKNFTVNINAQRNSTNLQDIKNIDQQIFFPSIHKRMSQLTSKKQKKYSIMPNYSFRIQKGTNLVQGEQNNLDMIVENSSQQNSLFDYYKKTISQVSNNMEKKKNINLNPIKKLSKLKNPSFVTSIGDSLINEQKIFNHLIEKDQVIRRNSEDQIFSSKDNFDNQPNDHVQRSQLRKSTQKIYSIHNKQNKKESFSRYQEKTKSKIQQLSSFNKLNQLKRLITQCQTNQISIQTDQSGLKILNIIDKIKQLDKTTVQKFLKSIQKIVQKINNQNKSHKNIKNTNYNNSNKSIYNLNERDEINNNQNQSTLKSINKINKSFQALSKQNIRQKIQQKKQNLISKNQLNQTMVDKQKNSIIEVDKKIKKIFIFNKNDFSLFLGEENAYKYQTNMKKKYHKTPSQELTKEQLEYFTEIYNFLQILKLHSPDLYTQIISFIKYPFQSVINDFSLINMIKQMSLSSFLAFMSRIKYYHIKCLQNKKQQKKCICQHVQKFIQKIQNIFADVSYQQMFNNTIDQEIEDYILKQKQQIRNK